MAVKIDMEKAFDFMEWSSISKIFNSLGFHSRWVKWIGECITTVSFLVVINGESVDPIHPTRSLREGDLLSPFLFILGSEVLYTLLIKEENEGNLKGIRIIRGGPSITHLLFADDLILFGEATP